MGAQLQTAVLGATGYSGMELVRLLWRHPRLGSPVLFRRSAETQDSGSAGALHRISGNGGVPVEPFSWSKVKEQGVDLLFLATPHEVSRELVPEAVARGLRVVDLSGAWRLKQAEHRAIYGFHDADPSTAAKLDESAIYGLPEVNRGKISNAGLVANPGCYATSVILALAPLLSAGLVDRDHGIVSDSKSGVSGAGKELNSRTHFVSVADNLSAYAVFGHRHSGEIVEQLNLDPGQFIFTPHLLPIPRGILSTMYLHLKGEMDASEIESCFRHFYVDSPWVRIFAASDLPQIQFSLQTNFCDIGFCLAPDRRRVVLVSCLDNLLKGAAGQAVQNMNLMYGWGEQEGLS